MLCDVGVLPVGLRAAAREEPSTDVGDPERVEDPRHRLVVRRGDDRRVERPARVVRRGGGASGPLGGDRVAERVEVFVVPAFRGKPRDPGLEEQPRLEPFQHALGPDVRDEEAAVDLEHHEAVAGQAA